MGRSPRDVPYLHTRAQIDEWMVLWRAGKSHRQIAKRYKVTTGVIAGVIHRNKAPEEKHAEERKVVRAPGVAAPGRPSTGRWSLTQKTLPVEGPPPITPGRRIFSTGRFRTCQWIEDAPTPDDSCKCGAPVGAGRLVYCQAHQARASRAKKREPSVHG